MELALIIVGGVIVVTLISAVADFLTKSRLAPKEADLPIQALEQRVALLEEKLAAQEQESARLSQELAFTTKLLEKKL